MGFPIQWLLSLYLMGAACTDVGSFVMGVDQNLPHFLLHNERDEGRCKERGIIGKGSRKKGRGKGGKWRGR